MMSKLSLKGTGSSAKLNSWVEPSFGGLIACPGQSDFSLKKGQQGKGKGLAAGNGDDRKSRHHKKRRAETDTSDYRPLCTDASPADQNEPWVDKHRPSSQEQGRKTTSSDSCLSSLAPNPFQDFIGLDGIERKAELAVHKKKVEEVENWLCSHLGSKTTHKGGAILLLTGPSGCGKTATLHVLARDLNFQIQEWINPSTGADFRSETSVGDTFDPDSRLNSYASSSQTGAFQEFLLRASKYNPLQMGGGNSAPDRKVILVEEFPNQFYRQPACLHDILRRFKRTSCQPLVFIVSDSLSGDRGSRLLFPKEVQFELEISHISFNPIAPTSLTKVLNRICTIEAGKSGGQISFPDKATLELLCSGCSGDIRSAINSLQFSSFTDQSLEKSLWAAKRGKSTAAPQRAAPKSKTKSRSSKSIDTLEQTQAIGGKDASLFLFRALGRILYCKRESYPPSEMPRLPDHLALHQRDRLLVDPEDVVERSHMSGEFFSLYLQQNYLDFFSDLDDIARASDYLSDTDFLTAEWTSRSTMMEYGSSVATRGLIHANSARAKADCQTSTGFRPLHKPHWLLVSKKYRENCQAAQSLFIGFCLSPVGLQTELVPYLAKLNNPMRNPAQIAFLQDVGHLALRKFPGRLKLETLGDKDPGLLDEDSEGDDDGLPTKITMDHSVAVTEPGPSSMVDAGADLPMSQPQPVSTHALMGEEDLLIEEYDSD